MLGFDERKWEEDRFERLHIIALAGLLALVVPHIELQIVQLQPEAISIKLIRAQPEAAQPN